MVKEQRAKIAKWRTQLAKQRAQIERDMIRAKTHYVMRKVGIDANDKEYERNLYTFLYDEYKEKKKNMTDEEFFYGSYEEEMY